MARIRVRVLSFVLAATVSAGGCAVLDADPSRVTLGELLTGFYDPQRTTGIDLDSYGVRLEESTSFCEAAASAPLRWTVDALVPMQVWVDTFRAVDEMPPAVAPAAQQLIDFTERRLHWSLTGEGARPTWDATTVAAARTVIDAAIDGCADLPLIVGLPRLSERPSGWAGMSEAQIAAHCDSIARRFEEGVVDFEADHGRPPRHQMEMDLPIEYYGTSDFHGLVRDADGRPVVTPVPGGACDLG